MTAETRTRWVDATELTTEHDIAGFGPVERIVRDGNVIHVTSASGATRAYSAAADVELYAGVFDENGRRLSSLTAEYKELLRKRWGR